MLRNTRFAIDETSDIRDALPFLTGERNETSLFMLYGVLRTSSPLPEGVEKGRLGQCYSSAGNLVITRSDEFVYCEGWATSSMGLPLQHAWCLDQRGNVVDPTWPHRENAQYLGIPIKTTALLEHVSNTLHWGIFTRGIPDAFAASPESFIEPNVPNAP